MRSLSKAFEIERMKVNNEIHDEKCIAHCHCTINAIEEDVKQFIRIICGKVIVKKGVTDYILNGNELVKFIEDKAGNAFCVEGEQC